MVYKYNVSRKLLGLVALLCWSFFGFAQTAEISGSVSNPILNRVVYLFQIVDGETKLIKSNSTKNGGAFVFSFEPAYEGFYMIGGFTALAGQFPLYLKKGDQLELMLSKGKMEFVGKPNEENQVLSSWNKLSPAEKMAFKKEFSTKNARFNTLMKQFVGFEMDFYALKNYALEKESPLVKTLLVKNRYKTDEVFLYPNGKALICKYADGAANLNKAENGLDFLSTDRQKGTYIFEKTKNTLKTYPQFEEMNKQYGKYFKDSSLKAKVEGLGEKLYNATPGRKGANFSFPDPDGKMVSLSDFKGKVVLVDVWATFCGPCKELIPALNQLEKELEDHKDLVFIGVAQDGPRAKNTWLKIIKEKQMGGIQLFAGGGNNVLAKDYKIKVMPRYLIFDRNGNVVTTEAPLPNNPGLKKMLLAELAK
ncbi:TlpA disulfide reductase family protein [Pedobacter gandavensis]|uniref:TlpA family protein disulfide reductase n=1 Tax=Pedobacter gandavensis TaxID=2679963 RepID=UPI00292FEE9B|nr:TlpA disulfide reductase family protein [Pedobacter gandavensis]